MTKAPQLALEGAGATGPDPVSLRGLAKLLGVSHTAVVKAVRDGRLRASVSRTPSGQPVISDPDLARREWEAPRAPSAGTAAEPVVHDAPPDTPEPPSSTPPAPAAVSPGRREDVTGALVAIRNGVIEVNRHFLALFFAVHADRISHWTRLDGLPVLRQGGAGKESVYDLGSVQRWSLDRAIRGAVPKGSENGQGKLSWDQERARQAAANADKIELELRVRRGELIEASEVEDEWAAIVGAARAHLLLLPSMLVQRGIVEQGQETDAEDLVETALRDLAGSEDGEPEQVPAA